MSFYGDCYVVNQINNYRRCSFWSPGTPPFAVLNSLKMKNKSGEKSRKAICDETSNKNKRIATGEETINIKTTICNRRKNN